MKSVIGIILCILGGFLLFPSCSRRQAAETQGTARGEGGENKYAEPMEVSISIWDIGTGMAKETAKDDAILNDLMERFNITIVPVNISWSDYAEKNRLWAATGQLPDVFCDYPTVAQYKQWAEEGVLKALPGDLSPWPEIRTALSDSTVAAYNIDGVFYTVPARDYKDVKDHAVNTNVIYRKDWAKDAGWDRPLAGLEDYIQMCKAVMARHPGVSGLTLETPGRIVNFMLGLYPYGALSFYVKENGLWKPSYATEEYARAMTGLRALWTEGILDRDAAINVNREGELKFFSGQSFSYATNNIRRINYNVELWKSTSGGLNAEDAIDFLELWPAPDGNRYHGVNFPGGHKTMLSSAVSDKKMERVLDLLEYMNQEDTLLTVRNGRENIDWKWENSQMISLLKPGETKNDKYPVSAATSFRALGAWGSWLLLEGKEMLDPDPNIAYANRRVAEWYAYQRANHHAPEINWTIQNVTTPGKERVGTFAVTDDVWPVIMGSGDPVTMWKAVVRDYESRGLKEAVEEMTAEARKLGL
jgi:putative aldouronate transport system substrate-binding protein